MYSEFTIAKYIRLSIEDAKSDSMSVENQSLIIDKHIAEMDIDNIKVLEFIDNGHSGMNFERPAVQELLELVRQGQVNCIIVKDISRFGRSMIDTGYYIERVFPLYRIRFISIADYFDSVNHDGDTGGMEIALKFLLHEYYSKDLSRKIKTAKRAKALRGEYISKNCVFGYRKSVDRLEIDETAADTVRLIYDMASKGQNIRSISTRLYEEKHLTPSEYKRLKLKDKESQLSCIWNDSTIHSILSDEQYIGTYITGKTRNVEVGSGVSVSVDKSEWIIIPNHHPAIISTNVFETVQKQLPKRSQSHIKRKIGTSERYNNISSPLKSMVICGYCGHKMQLSSTRNPMFQCTFARSAQDVECSMFSINTGRLEQAVLTEIHEQSSELISRADEHLFQNSNKTESMDSIIIADKARLALYESHVLGQISALEYKESKTVLDIEFQRAKQIGSAISKDIAMRSSYEKLRGLAENALNENELTKDLVVSFVEKVVVHPDNRIEVVRLHKSLNE